MTGVKYRSGGPLESPRQTVLVVLSTVLLCTLACIQSTPATSTPQETLTPTREPTTTPTPEQVISVSSDRMLGLTTAHFTLKHEEDGSSQLFPGVELLLVQGNVRTPDRFEVSAEAMSTFPRSFIPIDVVVVGQWAFMTDFIHPDQWNDVPVETLPFDFSDLGRTLSDIMLSLQGATFDGVEKVDGERSWHVNGTLPSERLEGLVPAADSGYQLRMELWIGQRQGWLRKVRIEGQILDTDRVDLVRVLTIHKFDEHVEISLP